MPLKLIGAGYPRTGTFSLKSALEQLGLGRCHHMAEIIRNPEQAALWARQFSHDRLDWDEVYAGYDAAVDAPTCFFFAELAERYPDAKLILSIRDAESWWNSAQATVMSPQNRERMMSSPNAPLLGPMMMKMREFVLNRPGTFPDLAAPDRDQAIAAFNRHNERVRESIPAERLLIFEASQGWEPLCRFLDVPVPDTPYPHANSREDFHQTVTSAMQRDAPSSH